VPSFPRYEAFQKLIFPGCHDQGYTSFLQSLITEGFGSKISLLQGYTEMPPAMHNLKLPKFSVPDLFMKEKIVNSPKLVDAIVTNGHIPSSPGKSAEVSSNSVITSYSHAVLKSPPLSISSPVPNQPKKRKPDPNIVSLRTLH
jgi:hypothetical protein